MRVEAEHKEVRMKLQNLESIHARTLQALEDQVSSEVRRAFSSHLAQLDTGIINRSTTSTSSSSTE